MRNKIIIIDMVNGFVKEGPLHDESILDIVDNINTVVEKLMVISLFLKTVIILIVKSLRLFHHIV